MKLETIKTPSMNRFLSDYLKDGQLHDYFHHSLDEESVKKRLQDLKNHSVRREELAQVIESYMKPFGISEKAQKHLEELKQDAVVVIGGQQAGLFTGPLYSVHKAISVILMAKQYREIVATPVVPVFWIAGEDHDLDEINHTYTISSGKLRKHTYPVPYMKKTMAAETELDHEEVKSFIGEVFRQYGETAHTETLLEEVETALAESSTFTDFFARLMNSLFSEEGLLLIDAAYGPLRSYESEYFEQMIERSASIAYVVKEKEDVMDLAGYGRPVGASEDAANLFYVHHGERVLLKRSHEDFINEAANVHLTKQELLKVARTAPQLLSNNVVTRPIMQEMVFPVLTFVGGGGEIAYWGLLKEAFEVMDMEMPIVAPRISMTLVDRKVGHLLEEEQLTVEDVLNGRVNEKRESFLAEVSDSRTEALLKETQGLIQEKYREIQEAATANRLLTIPLIEKNEAFHLNQLNYLLNKLEENTLIRHEVQLQRFETLTNHLMPEGLQERKFNPYMYLNQYGTELISDLLKLDYHLDGRHHIVYL